MLKITLAVESGIQEFVPMTTKAGKSHGYEKNFLLKHNEHNEHILHKGLLLRLMGEKFSQYAMKRLDNTLPRFGEKRMKGSLGLTTTFDEDRAELDTNIVEQYKVVNDFLDKLETKHLINTDSTNFNLQSFEQHRKDGFLQYPSFSTISEKLERLSVDNEPLSPYYKEVLSVDDMLGIFLVETNRMPEVCVGSLAETAMRGSEILRTLDFSSSQVTIADALRVSSELKSLFITDINKLKTKSFDNIFNNVTDELEINGDYVKTVNGLMKKPKLRDSEQVVLDSIKTHYLNHQIKILYYTYKYLSCEQKKADSNKSASKNPSKFDVRSGEGGSFNVPAIFCYSASKMINSLIEWLDDLMTPVTGSGNKKSHAQFKVAITNQGKCGTSRSAPVKSIKYDGTFELFIKTDSETEQLILDRMEFAKVWKLRVGKQCLGSLVSVEQAPNIFFDKVDEYEND